MIGEPFKIKQGDTRPTYVVKLQENIGQDDEGSIDFTDADSVAMIMRIAGAAPTDPPKLDKVAASFLEPRTSGEVEYVWAAGDTDTIGEFDVEWFVTWEPGAEETVPNEDFFRVEVTPDLD